MDVGFRLVSRAGWLLALSCALPGAAALAQSPSAIAGTAASQSFDPAPYVYADGGRSVLLGRYSTSSATPPRDLVEPIEAAVSITFPRGTVLTIRQAVDYTLMRSGYRFDDGALGDAAQGFLGLPLPEIQRQIGPYSLMSILDVLMGSAWQPVVNRVNRTVSMQLQPSPSAPARKPAASAAVSPPAPSGAASATRASPPAGVKVAAGQSSPVAAPAPAALTSSRKAGQP